jgi:membrane protein YdbS with pleckstrin-like domain
VRLSATLGKLTPVLRAGELPPAANRFLLDEERDGEHTFVHQHPAMVIPALTSVLGVLLGATIASVTARQGSAAVVIVWLVFSFMVVRSVVVILRWSQQYIVITAKTFILTSGILTRTVTAIPLVNLSGMTLERSPTGRLMGYAAFRLGADSPVQLVIDYVPYPEQLYLQIRSMIRTEQDKSPSG